MILTVRIQITKFKFCQYPTKPNLKLPTKRYYKDTQQTLTHVAQHNILFNT